MCVFQRVWGRLRPSVPACASVSFLLWPSIPRIIKKKKKEKKNANDPLKRQCLARQASPLSLLVLRLSVQMKPAPPPPLAPPPSPCFLPVTHCFCFAHTPSSLSPSFLPRFALTLPSVFSFVCPRLFLHDKEKNMSCDREAINTRCTLPRLNED